MAGRSYARPKTVRASLSAAGKHFFAGGQQASGCKILARPWYGGPYDVTSLSLSPQILRPSPAGRVGPGEREGYGEPRDVTSLSLVLMLRLGRK